MDVSRGHLGHQEREEEKLHMHTVLKEQERQSFSCSKPFQCVKHKINYADYFRT